MYEGLAASQRCQASSLGQPSPSQAPSLNKIVLQTKVRPQCQTCGTLGFEPAANFPTETFPAKISQIHVLFAGSPYVGGISVVY